MQRRLTAMRISNALPGILILALSAAIFIETRHLAYWTETAPGPGFFPSWLVLAGIILSLLQLIEAWRATGSAAEWPDRSAIGRACITYAGLVGLGILAPLLGMMPSIVLFVVFLLIVVLRRPVWPSLATTAVTVGLIYLIFVSWLGVVLPTSSLGI